MNNYEQATQEVRDSFNDLCRGRVEAAVEAEREVLREHYAKIADTFTKTVTDEVLSDFDRGWIRAATLIAANIRARGDI